MKIVFTIRLAITMITINDDNALHSDLKRRLYSRTISTPIPSGLAKCEAAQKAGGRFPGEAGTLLDYVWKIWEIISQHTNCLFEE